MKAGMIVLASVLMVGGLSGCGKTVTELRANGEAIVDNGGSLIKKVLDGAVAVYDVVKKVVEDTKDNVVTVKEVVTGTEAIPAK
jgi:hypothetical protein